MVQMGGPRDHVAGPRGAAELGGHFFSQIPAPALPWERRAMKPFRSFGTGSRQPVSNREEEKRGYPMAQGGLFGTRPDAALCIQVHPATRLLSLSQFAQGWGSSHARSLCTQARSPACWSRQQSTTGCFGRRQANLAGSSWPKDKAVHGQQAPARPALSGAKHEPRPWGTGQAGS